MAKTTLILTSALPTILLLSLLIPGKSHTFSRNLRPKELKREKLSHLHFYFHDTLSGSNPTAILVAKAPNTTTTATFPGQFGFVFVMDDPLTLGPEPNSKEVGRAQGIYSDSAQNQPSLLMALTFAFSEGKYNGSSLSLLGRNTVFSAIREMPVVGGSGLFRFARGYASAKTYSFNTTTGDAVVEYNVYVFHY